MNYDFGQMGSGEVGHYTQNVMAKSQEARGSKQTPATQRRYLNREKTINDDFS